MLAYRDTEFLHPSPASAEIDGPPHRTKRGTLWIANRWPGANDSGSANKPLPPAIDADEAAPTFSPLELLVIDISKRDPPNPATGRRWAWLVRLLFGIEVPRPLADSRLEALRVLAISLRRDREPDSAIEAALAAGVTRLQIEHFRTYRPRDLEG